MRWILFLLLLSNLIWARYVALLTETASGGGINSDKDIITMKKLLGDRYEFIILNQPEATSTNIRKKLERLARELNPNDTFVFYYSGHGDRFSSGDSHEADSYDDFLVTSDAICTSKGVKNVLIDDELNYLYAKIRAKKIIIIDACHSADMQKGVKVEKNNIKPVFMCKRNGVLSRGFDINPSWQNAKNRNFLHFGASKEQENALGSSDGGRFTLAIAKTIKERGNISFAELEKEVKRELERFRFHPSISKYSTIDKYKLYTKDIFAIPPRNLREILDNKSDTIVVKTQREKERYKVNKEIAIKGYPKSDQNIYLIELKGDNDFKLIASKPKCIPLNGKYMCQFVNLKATKPTGISTIYMIQTQKPLDFRNSKDSVITNEFFDSDTSLREQLESMDFEVGKVRVKTVL